MRQEHRLVVFVGIVLAVAIALVFLGEVIASIGTGHPLGWFTQDPSATYQGDAVAGIQSNLGVLALWSAASILFFTWWGGRSDGQDGQGFLLVAGLLSAALAIDDLLRLHDDLFVRLTGRSERLVFIAYAAAFGIWFVRYRRLILRSDQALLLLGMAAMGAAIVVDVLEHSMDAVLGHEVRPFVEDGVKFVGFVFWSAGLILHCRRTLDERRPVGPGGERSGQRPSA